MIVLKIFLRIGVINLKIVYLASEVAPFYKSGGLADVLGALPKKMQELGHEVSIIMPAFF